MVRTAPSEQNHDTDISVKSFFFSLRCLRFLDLRQNNYRDEFIGNPSITTTPADAADQWDMNDLQLSFREETVFQEKKKCKFIDHQKKYVPSRFRFD